MRGLALVLCVAASGCASLKGPGGDSADAAPDVTPRAGAGSAAVDGAGPHPEPLAFDETPTMRDVPTDDPQADDARHEPAPVGLWANMRADFRLPHSAHQRIQAEIRRYSGRQQYFAALAQRGQPYLDYIMSRIEARDLPAELALVPIVESGFRPFAYSHSQAGGIWQFKPATARHFGLELNWWYDGRRDVIASTNAALDYLEYLHDFFDGDWLLALAAYNAGEGRVQQAVIHNASRGLPTDFWHLDLPRQTEHYVPRILALRDILSAPEEHGIQLPAMDDDGAGLSIVKLDGQVDLALAARLAGISVKTVYRYNPGFNRWATPPDGPNRLAVPAACADRLRSALAGRDADDMVRWRRHKVARGETLSGIASHYHTTISALEDLNDLHGTLIRAGDHLLVPVASRPDHAYTLSAENRRRARQSQGPAGRQRVDYQVRHGDTLWGVARAHDVKVSRLARWNGMAPQDTLHPGQHLVIWVDADTVARSGPSQRVQRVSYTVRAGDSLYRIARQFNLSVSDIRRWNALDAGEYLQPGQRLKLRVDVTEQAEAG